MADKDELEFINVVEHGGAGGRAAGGGGGFDSGFDAGVPGTSGANGGGQLGFIRNSNHPVAAFFHIVFKAAAIAVYLFGSLFSSNFVFLCVCIILLLAFDFWTVKNITGRLMVGLRWWSTVKEDGTNEWVFESLENMEEIKPSDSKLFWLALYAAPLVWGALFFVGALKLELEWLIIVSTALTLSTANIVGYTKCSKDAKAKVKGLMREGMQRGAMAALSDSSIFSLLLSFFTGGGRGGGGSGGGSGGGAPPPAAVN